MNDHPLARTQPHPTPRALVFGAKGFMGQHFLARLPGSIPADVDITDAAAVAAAIDQAQPDLVINCAGKTGRPNVDWCETHQAETYQVNVTGARNILLESLRRDLYLVHLSSGCIYEGDRGGTGFTEEDRPNYAGSYYSLTKSIADQLMKPYPVLTLRLRMPFDGSLSDRNLLMKIRRYSRVLDVPNSLTYLPDFFHSALTLIQRRATGIYNMVNDGAISPYQIMLRYRQLVDPGHTFSRLRLEDLPQVATAGRSNCILSTAKLHRDGVSLRPVADAVDEALITLAANLGQPPSPPRDEPRRLEPAQEALSCGCA